MSLFEIIMIGIGLSMDAFAASICKGLEMPWLDKKALLVIGLFFGGFQALMPAIGFLLGKQFEQYIVQFDHWIAFALLSFIGGKMIYDVIFDDEEQAVSNSLNIKEIFTLAIATSIDALAVGVSFAFLQVELMKSVTIIGLITFSLSCIGVIIGHKFGSKYEKKATLIGGIILIIIGLKILMEHIGIIA